MKGSDVTSAPSSERQIYAPPALRVYGTLQQLTAGTKGGVKGDGPDNPTGPATRVVS